jgi:hypothetical protein
VVVLELGSLDWPLLVLVCFGGSRHVGGELVVDALYKLSIVRAFTRGNLWVAKVQLSERRTSIRLNNFLLEELKTSLATSVLSFILRSKRSAHRNATETNQTAR